MSVFTEMGAEVERPDFGLDFVFGTMEGFSTMETTKRKELARLSGLKFCFCVEWLHGVISYIGTEYQRIMNFKPHHRYQS